MSVPIIDLFAGPGGLGEGFSRALSADFRVAVSIEKDKMAFETLRLRAAHRALLRSGSATTATWRLWDTILADRSWQVAFEELRAAGNEAITTACEEAGREAWHVELGPKSRTEISAGIHTRLKPYTSNGALPQNIVLIGGPPCQAYSVVGRSRNRGTKGYRAEDDHRHFLYREYLHVISDFRPAVFIMENVKGILSSNIDQRRIFESILDDLQRPDVASGANACLEYELIALSHDASDLFDADPSQFIIEAEHHGIPQARHRVVICGIRKDVLGRIGGIPKLRRSPATAVKDVISDLPRIRSGISHRGKGAHWVDTFDSKVLSRAVTTLKASGWRKEQVGCRIESSVAALCRESDPGTGADRVLQPSRELPRPGVYRQWFRDRPLSLLANHESREHMPSDLLRYMFVSSFGAVNGTSPRLDDFPRCLLPAHKNVDPRKPGSAIFKDRFRVQVADKHSMTITSHIAKDGHAFIHPDPTQCRSLTVREAARLQTFPDSYVFLGTRTSQYTQVGNAVPPYLARQIAQLVGEMLTQAGLAREPGEGSRKISRTATAVASALCTPIEVDN